MLNSECLYFLLLSQLVYAVYSLFSGSSEESLDVCCSRGSGGAERANQRIDRKKLSTGTGKQPTEEFSQSGAAGTVSGPGSEWLSTIVHAGNTAVSDDGAAAPFTELWTLSVTCQEEWVVNWAKAKFTYRTRMPLSQEDYVKVCTYLKSKNLTKATLHCCTHCWQSSSLLTCWILPNSMDCDCWEKENSKRTQLKSLCLCLKDFKRCHFSVVTLAL